MMRKNIVMSTVLFTLLMSCSIKPKEQEQEPVQQSQPQTRNDLPVMPITLLNGTTVEANQLTGNTIIILFFPDCDHCQREAQAIQAKLDAFKDYTLYFVTTNPETEIQQFANEYKLSFSANVKFGRITPDKVFSNYGSVPTPSLYIYSADKKLKKQFNGETAIEEIISAL